METAPPVRRISLEFSSRGASASTGCPRHAARRGGLGAAEFRAGGRPLGTGTLGRDRKLEKAALGSVCVSAVGGERLSGCAVPQLARLCGDHVQEGRLGAQGQQPRWVTAPRPGSPGTGRVSVCASGWVEGPAPACSRLSVCARPRPSAPASGAPGKARARPCGVCV